MYWMMENLRLFEIEIRLCAIKFGVPAIVTFEAQYFN